MPPPLHSSTILPTAPHPSWLTPCHLPPGEGYPQKGRHPSATSDRTPPQSRRCRDSSPYTPGAFFVPSAPAAIFPLNNSYQAGGACRRPYIHRRYCLPPLIRHGLRHATFPQGKAILRRVGTLLRHPTVHPLSHGVAVTAPPTRWEPFLCLNSAKTPEGGPPVLVHFLILQRRLFDFCVSSGVF